jgi:N-carbamoylputrescine amidase
LTALQGAQILFYPTAIGWHPREKAEFGADQHQAWEMIQRSHAIANGVYVAAANRVGHELPAPLASRVASAPGAAGSVKADGLEFWGASFVSDPFGRLLHRADHQKEENVIVSCDLKRLEETRRNWPFLRDRRIDAYGDITRRMID